MIVKVYSTQMGEKSVETSATTWGQLQNDLNREGITHSGMKSVIGESKLTLEADAAILPSTGFTLFLMPKKTKAGADINTIGYKDLRAEICIILTKSENAKAHFNVGKNYTTKGTEELRGLLADWKGITLVPVEAPVKKKKATSTQTSRPTPTKQVVEKVEAVVESVKEYKEEEITEMEVFASDTDTIIEVKSPLACSFSAILVAIEGLKLSEHSLPKDFLEDIKGELDDIKNHALSLEDAVNLKIESLLKAEAKAKEEEESRRIIAEEKKHNEDILRNQEADIRRMFGDVQ